MRASEPAQDGRAAALDRHRAQPPRGASSRRASRPSTSYGPDASAEQIADDRRGQPHRPLPLLPRPEDLRQAIADHIVRGRHRQRAAPAALTGRRPRASHHGAAIEVIVGWLDEHPNLYHFLRGRRTGASLGAVESTLADHVADLLSALHDCVRHRRRARRARRARRSSASSSPAAAWWLTTGKLMSRERFTELICSRASGTCSTANRARLRHRRRLRRAAARRRCVGSAGARMTGPTTTATTARPSLLGGDDRVAVAVTPAPATSTRSAAPTAGTGGWRPSPAVAALVGGRRAHGHPAHPARRRRRPRCPTSTRGAGPGSRASARRRFAS